MLYQWNKYPEKLAQGGSLNTKNFVNVKKLPETWLSAKFSKLLIHQEAIRMEVATKVCNLFYPNALGLDVFQFFFQTFLCTMIHLPYITWYPAVWAAFYNQTLIFLQQNCVNIHNKWNKDHKYKFRLCFIPNELQKFCFHLSDHFNFRTLRTFTPEDKLTKKWIRKSRKLLYHFCLPQAT